jgi:hypothetical protein
MTRYAVMMKTIGPICFVISALFSPVVFIFGYPLGLWARKSRLAPRLGLAVWILTTLLLLSLAGVTAWFMVFPPPPTGLEADRLRPLTAYFYTGGPLSFLAFSAMFATLGAMILGKIRKRLKPAEVAGLAENG